jgi:hypothetical protein
MRNSRLAFTACMGLFSASANALDLTLTAGYDGSYTNNAALTPDDETSEWIHTPRATLGVAHDGPSTSANAAYSVSREMYQDNTYGDKTYAVGTASLVWRAVPGRLDFHAMNSNTRTTIDSRAQPVPSNEQVTSTTSTGTTLILDSFRNQTINIGYDYAWVSYDSTDTDSKRQTGTVSYVIPLSDVRRIQLNGSYGDVDYDDPLYDDYTSQSGDLQFVNEGDHFAIDASLGFTVFHRDRQDDVSGTTGKFGITWYASDVTSLSASYSRSIHDQSINATAGIPEFGESFTDDNSNITTPYTLDSYRVGVETQFGSNQINLTGYVKDQNYDGVQPGQTIQDQDTRGATLRITRPMRPTLTAQLYGNYSTNDYNEGDNQDTYRAGLRFNWTRWQRTSVHFGGAYAKRTSDVPSEEYTEWVGMVGVDIMLIGSRRSGAFAPAVR